VVGKQIQHSHANGNTRNIAKSRRRKYRYTLLQLQMLVCNLMACCNLMDSDCVRAMHILACVKIADVAYLVVRVRVRAWVRARF